MSHNPYEPPKSPIEPPNKPAPVPAVPDKTGAILLCVIGFLVMMFGAHFTEPARMANLASPSLRLVASAAHVIGGIVLIVGIYRVYRVTRDSR